MNGGGEMGEAVAESVVDSVLGVEVAPGFGVAEEGVEPFDQRI